MSMAPRSNLTSFRRSDSGSIAMMTAICFSAFILAGGMAVEMTRAQSDKQKVQEALDATTLMLARSSIPNGKISAEGERLFAGALKARGLNVTVQTQSFVPSKDADGDGRPDSVAGSAKVKLSSLFGAVTGDEGLTASVSATVGGLSFVPVEIGLVLDVSGSMSNRLNGKSRIEQLKESVDGMFQTLNDQQTNFAVSVVPYSTSVNITDVDQAALSPNSIYGAAYMAGDEVWAAERVDSFDGTNFVLSSNSPQVDTVPFMTRDDIAVVCEKGGYASADCHTPSSRMLPLTSNKTKYEAAITGLIAEGGTAAHLGMIWGVYSLLPNWSSIWAEDPKELERADKSIVILSDGDFNTTHNIGDRSTSDTDTSNDYFQAACALARDKGIVIYAVALKLSSTTEDRLTACVGDGAGKVFKANNANQLDRAFEAIAKRIGKLRLTS